GEKECCALRLAFKENRSAINDFLKDFVPARIIDFCHLILHRTQSLGWVPEVEDHKVVYREIAGMEIKRLKKEILADYVLDCHCKARIHIDALQKVIKLMGGISPVVN
ncbi:MAG: hypothetical protein Q8N69_00130, partial [bacterium]|nr:hypothetical protein [bacterium]